MTPMPRAMKRARERSRRAAGSNQPRVATQKRQTDSITGTSTSTPTTVASAAPEPGP